MGADAGVRMCTTVSKVRVLSEHAGACTRLSAHRRNSTRESAGSYLVSGLTNRPCRRRVFQNAASQQGQDRFGKLCRCQFPFKNRDSLDDDYRRDARVDRAREEKGDRALMIIVIRIMVQPFVEGWIRRHRRHHEKVRKQ